MDLGLLVTAFVQALIAAGIPRRLAELLAELLGAVTARLHAETAQPEVIEVCQAICDGIAAGHPDWDDATKRQFALDAIAQYLTTQGVTLRDSTRNVLLELAVVNLEALGDG
jgi:hypothetical protein